MNEVVSLKVPLLTCYAVFQKLYVFGADRLRLQDGAAAGAEGARSEEEGGKRCSEAARGKSSLHIYRKYWYNNIDTFPIRIEPSC